MDECRLHLDVISSALGHFGNLVLTAAIAGALTDEWRRDNPAVESSVDMLRRLRMEHDELSARRDAKQRAAPHSDVLDDVDQAAGYLSALPRLPTTWAWAVAAEVVAPGAEIVYGIVQPGPKLATGVSYVRGVDIENGRILADQLLRTSPEIARRYARSSLRAGDVLLGIIRATKVATVPASLDGANITQGTARFRPSSAILSDYLAMVLAAPNTQTWLHAHYRGIDMPGLNLADVRRVPIPLPPLDERQAIVSCVKKLLGFANHARERHREATTLLDQLVGNALSQAFRGELTARDVGARSAHLLIESEASRGTSRYAVDAYRLRDTSGGSCCEHAARRRPDQRRTARLRAARGCPFISLCSAAGTSGGA